MRPPGTDVDTCDSLIPCFAIQERAVCENPDAGPDGAGVQADIAYTLEARSQVQAVAYGGNRTAGSLEVAAALNAKGGTGRSDFESETLIAVSSKDDGADACTDLAPTLRAMGHAGSQANGGGQLAVAFALRGRDGGAMPEMEGDTAGALRAASGGSSRSYVAGVGVRRLLPVECEALMGLPRNWTRIPIKHLASKPKSKHFQKYPDQYDRNPDGTWTQYAADGPRYKALGNSFPVPVLAWIARKIIAAEAAATLPLPFTQSARDRTGASMRDALNSDR